MLNGIPCMKTQHVNSLEGVCYNAVILPSRFLMTLDDDDNVVILDADLVIK